MKAKTLKIQKKTTVQEKGKNFEKFTECKS